MDAFEQGLDVEPSAPEGFPARWPVPFASQIAPKAGDGVPALLHGQLGSRHPCSGSHDLHHLSGQRLARGLLGGLPGRRSQLQEPYSCWGQQPQQAANLFLSMIMASSRFG